MGHTVDGRGGGGEGGVGVLCRAFVVIIAIFGRSNRGDIMRYWGDIWLEIKDKR